jgi:hypothetical protein
MTKKLARLLRADIQETSDLKSIAKMLANKGRGKDTILAHITPKEASILREAGGSGTTNPETGLLEFEGGFEDFAGTQQDIINAITPQSYDYIAPQNAPESSFATDYSAPVQQLTAPDISPEQYYLEQAAGQQYAGSAFPYQTAQAGIPDVGWNEAITPGSARDIALQEFPPSSAAYLNLGQGTVPAAAPGVAPVTDQARQAVAAQQAAGGTTAGADQRSFLQKYVGDPLASLKKETGLSAADLLRIGGAGAGAIVGRQQAQQAAKQIQAATQEQKNVGQPYQQAGQELQRAAMSGELTPQGAQAYQAMRAQMAQGVESRGGVGVAQAQAQVEAFRQQLLANQYNLGLQVAQIGDNIALGAIRTGMQLDQQLSQANQQFYTQLAQIAGGGTYGYAPQQTRGTP